MHTTPRSVRGTPTGVIVNIPISNEASSGGEDALVTGPPPAARSLSTRLVAVPRTVQHPPKVLAKERGISSFEGGCPVLPHQD
jgi:hypothetical protein